MSGGAVRCAACRAPVERVASISGRFMGDEYSDVYYFCEACRVYTLRSLRDVFLGPESERESPPLSKSDGDEQVRLIRTCSRPWDGRCRCESHMHYFRGCLD